MMAMQLTSKDSCDSRPSFLRQHEDKPLDKQLSVKIVYGIVNSQNILCLFVLYGKLCI